MTDKERVKIIREGNKSFNEKKFELAKIFYTKANYKNGLLKIADYYFYDLKQPINALSIYIKCGQKNKINTIYKSIAFTISKLIKKDEKSQKKQIKNTIKNKLISVDNVKNEIINKKKHH